MMTSISFSTVRFLTIKSPFQIAAVGTINLLLLPLTHTNPFRIRAPLNCHISIMDSPWDTKPHAVLVPYPSQGHINPFMQLATVLHSRGFHITFVNTQFNHGRLVRSKGRESVNGLPDFRFETIPDGLPPSNKDSTQDPWALCDSLRKNCLAPFKELVQKINSAPESPTVTLIISDGAMSFAIKAAEELGIPEVQFWTASACGLMGYLQYGDLMDRGIIPFKDNNFTFDGSLEAPIDWIPGMSNLQLKDIPSFIRTTNPDDIMLNFMKDEAENCFKASTIIFNTFDELEHEVLEAIKTKFPHIYTIGPLALLDRHMPQSQARSLKLNLWAEDRSCLEWLDKREPNSVLYVNYGCIALMSDQHFKELAWGLANSKCPFFWVVRPDLVTGSSDVLPEEYYEEIKDRGFLTTWCPQDEVLSNPAIGAFLTHCGWNSTLESISNGVPLLCWPFFAEQQTNCRYSCTVWEIGMEVNQDVKRQEIEVLVKQMMEMEKGKQLKENALEWKKKSEEATSSGGSSYKSFERFIKEVLLSRK